MSAAIVAALATCLVSGDKKQEVDIVAFYQCTCIFM